MPKHGDQRTLEQENMQLPPMIYFPVSILENICSFSTVTGTAPKCQKKGQAQVGDAWRSWEACQRVFLPTPSYLPPPPGWQCHVPCGCLLLAHCKMWVQFYFYQHKWPLDDGMFWRMVVYSIGKQPTHYPHGVTVLELTSQYLILNENWRHIYVDTQKHLCRECEKKSKFFCLSLCFFMTHCSGSDSWLERLWLMYIFTFILPSFLHRAQGKVRDSSHLIFNSTEHCKEGLDKFICRSLGSTWIYSTAEDRAPRVRESKGT